ncbi:Uma2 family endonuclease [bacterium]|nr:Uma2 family endonuclease [bacterium]MBU1613984.1 Uma2 family endonuclease [bacterium]
MGLAVRKEERYTYQDYITWPDEERWEIIDGEVYDMSPAPRVKHQNIASNFHIKLKTATKNTCYTGIAPTDVVFDEYNIVQPDVFVVCDKNKITEANIQGAPDLIIEVISPTTGLKDKREKKALYERFGVSEYILVYPEGEYIERFHLDQGNYNKGEIFNWDEEVELYSVRLKVRLAEIFEKEKEN